MSRLDDIVNNIISKIDNLPSVTLSKWYRKFGVYTKRDLANAVFEAEASVIYSMYSQFNVLAHSFPNMIRRTKVPLFRCAPAGKIVDDINERLEGVASMAGSAYEGMYYTLKTRAPTDLDSSYDVPTIWINVETGSGWLLTSVTGGIPNWEAVTASGDVATLQNDVTAIQADLENKISSEPAAGEYKVAKIRLDSNKHFVVTYEEDPE